MMDISWYGDTLKYGYFEHLNGSNAISIRKPPQGYTNKLNLRDNYIISNAKHDGLDIVITMECGEIFRLHNFNNIRETSLSRKNDT